MKEIKKFIFLVFSVMLLAKPASGVGEKYSEQGSQVAKAVNQILVKKGICKPDLSDCTKKLTMYGGHGNRVNFSIYNPDKRALAAMVEFLIDDGIRITEGVPIHIYVYANSRESYGSLLFSAPKPVIYLEINK